MAQMDAAIAEGLPVPREAEESLRVAAERYDASPVDTERVVLPKEVEELTEVLAKNAHDEWASQRFSDGWIWGAKRDDELKHHPCLVPYEDLTETEREYDRITSMKTLKLLIGLGFSIVQLRSGSADNGHEPIGEDSSCDGGAAMAQMDAAIAEGLPVPREAEESLRVAAERYDASPVDTERVVLPK